MYYEHEIILKWRFKTKCHKTTLAYFWTCLLNYDFSWLKIIEAKISLEIFVQRLISRNSCCFMLLHVASCCFMLLHVASCCFMLLHVASCCFMLLIIRSQSRQVQIWNHHIIFKTANVTSSSIEKAIKYFLHHCCSAKRKNDEKMMGLNGKQLQKTSGEN